MRRLSGPELLRNVILHLRNQQLLQTPIVASEAQYL